MKCNFNNCNKKISIIQMITNKCRCKNHYCYLHKIEHDCMFNYLIDNKERLLFEMQKIDGDKVPKI